jgi:DNA-binding beta-propeller fold protein YncE
VRSGIDGAFARLPLPIGFRLGFCTVPLPADLVALGGRPHDVIVDPVAPAAYVTMLGFLGAEDYVLKFDTTTFREEARQKVGKDPHLSLTWRNNSLYVPCQGSSRVFVLDRRTMAVRSTIELPGAHGAGMTVSGRIFYTTNFSSAGTDGLFAIDTESDTVVGVANTPYSTPHNVVVTPNGHKVFVAHSGPNNQVSVYRVHPTDPRPRLAGSITVGQNPFGIDYVP